MFTFQPFKIAVVLILRKCLLLVYQMDWRNNREICIEELSQLQLLKKVIISFTASDWKAFAFLWLWFYVELDLYASTPHCLKDILIFL